MDKDSIKYLRVDNIVTIILSNDEYMKSKRAKDLTDEIAKQFGYSERSAQRDIKEAKRIIRGMFKKEHKKLLEKGLRDREYLIRKYKKDDPKLALEAMKDREKLLDLYPDQKVKQTNTNLDVDLSKLTKKGLKRIARGDDPKEVLMDPESVRLNSDD